MKSVLMSIQPKWCELIVNGKKTVEVRKTKPKLETPFKVYIYCTYGEGLIEANDEILPNHLIGQKVSKEKTWGNCCNGKVIGEFMCNEIDEYQAEFTDLMYFNSLNENVCLNSVKRIAWRDDEDEPYYIYETSNEEENPNDCKLLKSSCLTFDELRKYIGKTFYDKSFYGWHISNLVIYDNPRELGEFSNGSSRFEFSNTEDGFPLKWSGMTRPPQSWCYVEGKEDEGK